MILDIISDKKNFFERKKYFEKYNSATPFPHIIFDNFLDKKFLETLHDEARSTLKSINVSNDFTQKNGNLPAMIGQFLEDQHLISYLF